MVAKPSGKPSRAGRVRRNTLLAAGVLLGLIAAGSALPGWRGGYVRRVPPHSTATQETSPSPTPPPLAKEYIYLGDRLIAVEEPSCSTAVSRITLSATASSTNRVKLSWSDQDAAAGRVYKITRKQGEGGFVPVADVSGNTYVDSPVQENSAYVYQVIAGRCESVSNKDLATTIVFTDDPLVPMETPVKADHMTELRRAINAVRHTAGLDPAPWEQPTPATGGTIYAGQVQELRDNLAPALTRLGLPPPDPYDPDPIISSGLTIKAAHVQQIRKRMK